MGIFATKNGNFVTEINKNSSQKKLIFDPISIIINSLNYST